MRAWLQAHHLTWLTPERMRRLSVALVVAAVLVPSLTLSGSTKRPAATGRASVSNSR
ncbi:MAG: hypothetical protein NVSMB25_04440 [Thermoleophilaceae bacterium]